MHKLRYIALIFSTISSALIGGPLRAEELPSCAVYGRWWDSQSVSLEQLQEWDKSNWLMIRNNAPQNPAILFVKPKVVTGAIEFEHWRLYDFRSGLLTQGDKPLKIRSSYHFDIDSRQEATGSLSQSYSELWFEAITATTGTLHLENGARFSSACEDNTVSSSSRISPSMTPIPAPIAGAGRALGMSCSVNNQCVSDYCADSKKCAPKDGFGMPGVYCHHNNQCASGSCYCPNDDQEWGFCKQYERYSDAQIATYLSRRIADRPFSCRFPEAVAASRVCKSDADCAGSPSTPNCVSRRCVGEIDLNQKFKP